MSKFKTPAPHAAATVYREDRRKRGFQQRGGVILSEISATRIAAVFFNQTVSSDEF